MRDTAEPPDRDGRLLTRTGRARRGHGAGTGRSPGVNDPRAALTGRGRGRLGATASAGRDAARRRGDGEPVASGAAQAAARRAVGPDARPVARGLASRPTASVRELGERVACSRPGCRRRLRAWGRPRRRDRRGWRGAASRRPPASPRTPRPGRRRRRRVASATASARLRRACRGRLAAGSAPRRAPYRRAGVRRQCGRTDGVGGPLAAGVGDQRVASRSLKPIVVALPLRLVAARQTPPGLASAGR